VTRRKDKETSVMAALAAVGGVLTLGGFAAAVISSNRAEPKKTPLAAALTLGNAPRASSGDAPDSDDIEAAARMLASENAKGSRALWIEQVWSQIHAKSPGQSLFQRITAGSGYGPQGERSGQGKVRPVSTQEPAQSVHWQLALEVLSGLHRSRYPGAIAFFEPAEQDRALEIAGRARKKLQMGQPLTAQEQRLQHYRKSAEEVRREWKKSMQLAGVIDGVEFYEMNRSNPERNDFAARAEAKLLAWPIAQDEVSRIGDSVMQARPGTGQPHYGVDIFAPPGTIIRAARSGRVRRVVDGRGSDRESMRRAGLWVDVAVGDQIDRYLHLGEALVAEGARVRRGDPLGAVAAASTSGTGQSPHLHFEVRAGDYSRDTKEYGPPIQPKFKVI